MARSAIASSLQRKGTPGCLPAEGAPPKRRAGPAPLRALFLLFVALLQALDFRFRLDDRRFGRGNAGLDRRMIDALHGVPGDFLDVDRLDRLQRGTDRRLDAFRVLSGATDMDGVGVNLANYPVELGAGRSEVAAKLCLVDPRLRHGLANVALDFLAVDPRPGQFLARMGD